MTERLLMGRKESTQTNKRSGMKAMTVALIWNPHTKQKIFQLEKVQRRALSNYDYRSSVTAIYASKLRMADTKTGRYASMLILQDCLCPCGSATASLYSTTQ